MKPLFLLIAILSGLAFGQPSGPRTRLGDDPAWASPQYDDSDWQPFPAVAPPQRYADLIHNATWTRWRVQVPVGEPMLFRASCLTDCRVWLDGQPVGDHTGRRVARVVVPAPPGQSVTVAVRSWLPPGAGMLGQNYGRIELRPAAELAIQPEDSIAAPHTLTALALAVIVLYALLQILTSHASRDVRLRTLLMVAFLITNGGSFATAMDPATSAVFMLLVSLPLVALLALDAGGIPWRPAFAFLSVYCALRLPYVIGAFLEHPASWTPLAVRLYLASLFFVFAVVLFLRERARRRGASTWLMAAAVVAYPMYILNLIRPDWFPVGLPVAGVVFRWNHIATLVYGLAGAVDVVLQNRREQAAATRLQGELDSGRQAQLDLVSSSKAPTPGYEVEVEYQPAGEVGGDFYVVLPRRDGSTLVVVGDVSGKGLQAAMRTSLVIGVIRTHRDQAPTAILTLVNQVLADGSSKGFVTACAMVLRAQGQVDYASAGHLAPLCNGREWQVPDALPLGVVSDLEVSEVQRRIEPGEQLTLLTDGVIEAANPKGDLFGFDRTREISMNPAQEIAEAARAWGQNDDITVVTVRRLG